MENLPVTYAEVMNCKKLQNLDYISVVKTLEKIICDKCGPFSSISFIRELESLVHFVFFNIDVLDGDMSPCLSVDYTSFTNKAYFSHTWQQIDKLKGCPDQKKRLWVNIK